MSQPKLPKDSRQLKDQTVQGASTYQPPTALKELTEHIWGARNQILIQMGVQNQQPTNDRQPGMEHSSEKSDSVLRGTNRIQAASSGVNRHKSNQKPKHNESVNISEAYHTTNKYQLNPNSSALVNEAQLSMEEERGDQKTDSNAQQSAPVRLESLDDHSNKKFNLMDHRHDKQQTVLKERAQLLKKYNISIASITAQKTNEAAMVAQEMLKEQPDDVLKPSQPLSRPQHTQTPEYTDQPIFKAVDQFRNGSLKQKDNPEEQMLAPPFVVHTPYLPCFQPDPSQSVPANGLYQVGEITFVEWVESSGDICAETDYSHIPFPIQYGVPAAHMTISTDTNKAGKDSHHSSQSLSNTIHFNGHWIPSEGRVVVLRGDTIRNPSVVAQSTDAAPISHSSDWVDDLGRWKGIWVLQPDLSELKSGF